MLKKVWVGILLILMINLPGLATGQDVPSGKWWYNQKVVQNLNLTQKEIRQLDQAWVDSQRKLIKLKNAVEREQFELDTMLGKKTVDDAKVRKQFDKPIIANQGLLWMLAEGGKIDRGAATVAATAVGLGQAAGECEDEGEGQLGHGDRDSGSHGCGRCPGCGSQWGYATWR